MTHSLFLNLEKDYRMNYYDFIKDAVSKLKLAFDSDMQEYLEEVHFEKNDFLLKAGQVSKHHYFILDGILRFYYLKDGNEVVSNFSFPNDICASYRSYLLQQPSLEFIQAITPGKAYRIKVNDFGALRQTNSTIQEIENTFLSAYTLYLEERLISIQFHSAAGRYQYLIDNYPMFVQKLPLMYVASYLGITLETLSRIRGKK